MKDLFLTNYSEETFLDRFKDNLKNVMVLLFQLVLLN